MTYERHETRLEGFPFQYEQRLADILNEGVQGVYIDTGKLAAIREDIKRGSRKLEIPTTEDETGRKYDWFGGMEFEMRGGEKLAILFPFGRERSISVHGTKEFCATENERGGEITGLLEEIASLFKKYRSGRRRS